MPFFLTIQNTFEKDFESKKQNFLAKSIDFQNNYVYLQPCNYDG